MKSKILSIQTIKTKTAELNLCKIDFCIYSDGITSIRKRVLSKDLKIDGFEIICTKFGKSLFQSVISFKYDTLYCIATETTKILCENKISRNDILR